MKGTNILKWHTEIYVSQKIINVFERTVQMAPRANSRKIRNPVRKKKNTEHFEYIHSK